MKNTRWRREEKYYDINDAYIYVLSILITGLSLDKREATRRKWKLSNNNKVLIKKTKKNYIRMQRLVFDISKKKKKSAVERRSGPRGWSGQWSVRAYMTPFFCVLVSR